MNEENLEFDYELGLAVGAGALKFGDEFEIVDVYQDKVYSYVESGRGYDLDLLGDETNESGYSVPVDGQGKVSSHRDADIDVFNEDGELRYVVREKKN